nr:similar to SET domain and mariner transposase [Haemonchus contortus]
MSDPMLRRMFLKKTAVVGWDQLVQPAYSPDLALSDYHLFRSKQVGLADIRFRNAEELRKWVDDRFVSKDEDFFRPGVNKIPERWQEVVANDGQYIG